MDRRGDINALPKAHLHVHLFGSVRRSTIAEIAARDGASDAEVATLLNDIDAVHDITSFLTMAHAVQAILATVEDVERICREFIVDEAAAGVVHTEPSFVPHDYARRFGITPEEMYDRMDTAMREEAAKHDMTLAYIIAPNRGRDQTYLREVAEFAVSMRRRGVVALGYGGDEGWGHMRMLEAIEIAHRAGLAVEPHAGETMGSQSVTEALDVARPQRIAHGVRAADDPDVVARLVRVQVPCNTSIGSNVALGVVAAAADHPLPRLLRAGVAATLNADDTTFFSASLADEYRLARESLGCDDPTLADLARNSIQAAFMPSRARKRALLAVDAWEIAAHAQRGQDRGVA